MPREFWRVKIKNVQDPRAQRAIVRYLKKLDDMHRRGVGMFFYGSPGVGKTSAAILVCKEARSYGYTVFFTSVWEMRESIKSKMNFDDDNTFMDKARDCDLVVLDDVKAEERKDPYLTIGTLSDLVTYRCSQSRPTLLTTRGSGRTIANELASLRDAGMGKIVPIPIEGKDLRQLAGASLKDELLGDDDGS